MAALEVDISEAGNALRRMLGSTAKVAIGKGMLSTALRAQPLLVEASRRAPPASRNGQVGAFNTGNYARAWKAVRLPDLGPRSGGWLVHIFNQMPYAGVIEYGRRPGSKRPPTGPIALWATRRLGLPYAEARSVAFAIARSIGRRGLRPRHVLTSDKMQTELGTIMREEVMKALIAQWKQP